jgi:hypothetical protein
MPEEMIGVVPSSINVPRLLASIIRSQYIGSEVSEDTMPYSGIWLMTRKMRRVHCSCFSPVSSPVAGFSYSCPHQLLVKGDLGLWCSHLREEGRERFDQIEEAN